MKDFTEIEECDIYDFDKTLIPFDSGSLFWLYCVVHYPWILVALPKQAAALFLYLINVYDLTKMKTPFFSYVKMIPMEKAVKKFWDKHEKYIYPLAHRRNRERYSVMISASPDFLIKEISARIDIDDFISTVHDKKGRIVGKNCHDKEKVNLFRKRYPNTKVINVFSDSIKNDKYIFSLAENCFQAVKGKMKPFIFNDIYGTDKESVCK